MAYRILLAGWFLAARLLILYFHGGKRPDVLEGKDRLIGIFNPSEERTFKNGKYVDNFKPGLYEFYEKNGIPSFYVYPFNFPLSTAKYVGNNRKILWPLILDASFFSIAKRVCAAWSPGKTNGASLAVNGIDVALLMERERCVEFSSAGFNTRLILFDALDRFLKKGWCRSVVYVFENQPWEKMLCMACSANNIKAVGYQHSSIWKLYLSQFAGRNEAGNMPLPAKIVTAGNRFAQLYKEGGIPEGKVAVGGAWRYRNAAGGGAPGNIQQRDSCAPVVLVTLPIDFFIARSLLENLRKAVSAFDSGDRITFLVKPHPGYTRPEMRKVEELSSGLQITRTPLDELLQKVDIVVSAASTAGLEAFLCGKKAIVFIPENLLAADPLLDIEDDNVAKWYEGEDIDTGFICRTNEAHGMERIKKYRAEYFGSVDEAAWLSLAGSSS